MPNFETPEPISVTFELGVGNVRIAASDRTDTTVDVRPSDESDESDVQAVPSSSRANRPEPEGTQELSGAVLAI